MGTALGFCQRRPIPATGRAYLFHLSRPFIWFYIYFTVAVALFAGFWHHQCRRDLTQMALRNGGIFPRQRAIEVIDGRAQVSVHGERDMPVMGRLVQVSRQIWTGRRENRKSRARTDHRARGLPRKHPAALTGRSHGRVTRSNYFPSLVQPHCGSADGGFAVARVIAQDESGSGVGTAERDFRLYCSDCHGESGRGDGPKTFGLSGPRPRSH